MIIVETKGKKIFIILGGPPHLQLWGQSEQFWQGQDEWVCRWSLYSNSRFTFHLSLPESYNTSSCSCYWVLFSVLQISVPAPNSITLAARILSQFSSWLRRTCNAVCDFQDSGVSLLWRCTFLYHQIKGMGCQFSTPLPCLMVYFLNSLLLVLLLERRSTLAES